ncbi:MAG TPA: YunC family protein [Gemmataceae bacterium]|nr:YunC family protein [Gemmataceae bacterium]
MPQEPAIPRSTQRPMSFDHGEAIGISNRWNRGQYCTILTPAGLVGCGIYDVKTAAEFGQAVAICRGTPAKPLVEPEDLLPAKIVEATPQAQALGIRPGMTGKQAVELLLQAKPAE